MPYDETGNEWKMVTRADRRRVIKGKIRRGQRRPTSDVKSVRERPHWTVSEQDRIVKTLSDCAVKFPTTDIHKIILSALDNGIDQIVCFGIGNLAMHPSPSMWQLACALSLRTALQERQSQSIDLFFYDPLTSTEELEIMEKHYDVTVLPTNDRGERAVDGHRTLFFMPHCPVSLYRNVVLTNWDELVDHVLIIGNSILNYVDQNRNAEALLPLCPFLKERTMEASSRDLRETEGDLDGAFNDTYLSSFVRDEGEVWPSKPEELNENRLGEDGEMIV